MPRSGRGLVLLVAIATAVTLDAAAARSAIAAVANAATSAELAGARRVFEANLAAIRHRDRSAYLACYLKSPGLARTGPTGFVLGYASMESTRSNSWPDHIEALDLRLTPVRPGVVYGTYRYRVRYGTDEQSGLSERLFLATPQGWKIAVSTAFQSLPGVPPPPRAIVGATLIDGRGGPPVPDAVVVLRDGRIECAGPRSRCPVPAGVDTLDARGAWVMPGLVDAHVHYSQTGWADGRPDALDLRDEFPYDSVQARLRAHPETFHRSWLASGVTAVFDVGGFPWTMRMRDDAGRSTWAPHVSAAGPLLSTVDHWLNLPAERQFIVLRDEAAAREGVRYLRSIGADAVKVWFIVRPGSDFAAMERAVDAAGAAAKQAGLPLIVHATGLREAKAALRAGARYLVHSVDDLPIDDEFIALAKKNGTLYCPTLTVRDGYVRLAESQANDRAPVVDDPNGVVDSLTLAHVATTAEYARRAKAARPAPRRSMADMMRDMVAAMRRLGAPRPLSRAARLDSLHRMMAANLMRVARAGIPIATGTDAGNPLTLHGPSIYAEMETMQRDGMRPMDVLVASTRNGARAMGREKEFGTVEPGKSADLIIVGADPTRDVANLRRLKWVVRGGVVRSLEELRAVIHPAAAR